MRRASPRASPAHWKRCNDADPASNPGPAVENVPTALERVPSLALNSHINARPFQLRALRAGGGVRIISGGELMGEVVVREKGDNDGITPVGSLEVAVRYAALEDYHRGECGLEVGVNSVDGTCMPLS